ncbi:hypothetical protein [Ciceribacter ferrooxidans]|uniref:hypothetical protein n=1 Tax=Ciceribacter ferrooxidans TaxID=2509717 RepID=UPI00196B1C46|nr:hypothetical protein [Ciceribacter ferrooxidans]
MSRIFDVDGNNLDPGFVNIKAQQYRAEQEMYELIEARWETYEPYADPDFRHGFARDVDGRFWEMYLGCTLLEAGRALLPAAERLREGGSPTFASWRTAAGSGSRRSHQMTASLDRTRSCVPCPSTRAGD